MTKEQLSALGVLLLDLRDWLEETDPGCLDAGLVDSCVDVCRRARARLVEEGQR